MPLKERKAVTKKVKQDFVQRYRRVMEQDPADRILNMGEIAL
jgi:hypothetical protein